MLVFNLTWDEKRKNLSNVFQCSRTKLIKKISAKEGEYKFCHAIKNVWRVLKQKYHEILIKNIINLLW